MLGEGDLVDHAAKVLPIDVFQVAVVQAGAQGLVETVGAAGKAKVIADAANTVTREVLII
ncbi:hypothetical protein D9M68_867460 [compost metagenome]